MTRSFKNFGALPLLLLFAFPLISGLYFALNGLFRNSGWTSLLSHPQLWSATELSLITGLASTVLSLIIAIFIITGLYQSAKLSSITGVMMAVPHVALAIGVSFLIMPSGIIARMISIFTGWQSPPNWITTHDPYGLALIASLTLKETPFLIWIVASMLNREDVRRSFAGQRAAALSLGHGINSIWLRIFLPQILPKIMWPLLVTFTYAATVVDMSLVIGPTQPPTMAVVVWADINDAIVENNARGAAGAWFLTGAVALTAAVVWGAMKLQARQRGWLTVGPMVGDLTTLSILKFSALIVLYTFISTTLLLLSFALLWPFPLLWPETLSAAAWGRVVQNPSALITSLVLGVTTCATALALVLAWLESQPASRDRVMLLLSAMALGLPAILLSLGLYRAFLQVGLTGTAFGLFIAHLIPVTAYMFIVVVSPYRSFDSRWRSTSSGLLASFPRFLWAIKIPMLKAPLLAASAIGFAVSFGQYVPAQLIAAGRTSTLPMEAVTLTSGSNRSLTAAFALLLMLPPMLAFLTAAYFNKSRWAPT